MSGRINSPTKPARRVAAMGCAYGNVPALAACVADTRAQRCDTLVFRGDATGINSLPAVEKPVQARPLANAGRGAVVIEDR